MKGKKSEEQELRERLREEIEVSRLWPMLRQLVEAWVVSSYQRLRSCEGLECARLQGEINFADRILGLDKNLKADDVIRKITGPETNDED